MKSLRIKLHIAFFLFTSYFSLGQIEQYKYKRELSGVSEQWHKLKLPDEIFGKISKNFNDIRVFGITPTNDTIESPYILKLSSDKIQTEKIDFKIINTSFNASGYFFTFQIPKAKNINQIKLDFKQENFDWKVTLEGSNDQREWFTILDKYRILAIDTESVNFQYTDLQFPSANYHFFRVFIETKEIPLLKTAYITQNENNTGVFRDYEVRKKEIIVNKELKQTEIDIELQMPLPVSFFKLKATDSFDFYRPITVTYAFDSIKTADGYKYIYQTLASGIVNSIENNGYFFNSTILKKLKVIIDNQDNQPLKIDAIQIKGYEHELHVRFSEKANYFLTYGSENAIKPFYDIQHFEEKVPTNLNTLEVGNEQKIGKIEKKTSEALFVNEFWLWIIILIIMIVLGYFSIKMIQKTNTETTHNR